MTLAFIIASILAATFLCTVISQDAKIKDLKEELDAYKKVTSEAQRLYEEEREKNQKRGRK